MLGCERNILYRMPKEHTKVMDVLVHSEPWSLFIMAIVKQNIFA